jgi:predicted metal-dependent hydrolase
MQQIVVSNIPVDVIKKDIKNLHLGVYPPDGRVRIAAPMQTTDEAIRLFAISKLSWIRRNQKAYAAQSREAPREYLSGESHFVAGRRYLLNVLPADKRQKVVLGHKHLDIYASVGSSKEDRAKILSRFYRTQLKKKVPDIIKKWEQALQVSVASFGIKKMKTKWGTCNIEERRIWINLELAKKPAYCLDYIVLHEMVHLLVRHHNDAFIQLMDTHMPSWRTIKEELNRLPL